VDELTISIRLVLQRLRDEDQFSVLVTSENNTRPHTFHVRDTVSQ
jgi:hypothetical protein